MRRMVTLSLTALMLVVFGTGCSSIVGDWVVCQYQPCLSKDAPRLSKVSFYENNSFESVALKGKQTIKSKGTYCYDAGSKALTLVTCDNKVRCYEADLSNGSLAITSYDDCMATTAFLKRCYRCPKRCAKPACYRGCKTGCRSGCIKRPCPTPCAGGCR